jgi:hypothetical protein
MQIQHTHDLYFENIEITAKKAFDATDAKNIFMKNVKINAEGKPYKLLRTENILLDGKPVM